MGQYNVVVNLDRQEALQPTRFGDGLKLFEFGLSAEGTMTALAILLAVSEHSSRVSSEVSDEAFGRWAGDRIAIVGDYATAEDVPGFDFRGAEPFDYINTYFREISDLLIPIIEKEGF